VKGLRSNVLQKFQGLLANVFIHRSFGVPLQCLNISPPFRVDNNPPFTPLLEPLCKNRNALCFLADCGRGRFQEAVISRFRASSRCCRLGFPPNVRRQSVEVIERYFALAYPSLSDHPKPANEYHLKTGQLE
jgi:hypothetical protein